MRRREFIQLVGCASVAMPHPVRAQQPAMQVIGYLHPAAPETTAPLVTAFRKGLSETGYVEGRNVTIEYRWANNDPHQLPDLAADLISRRVAVIATPGNSAAVAAKATGTTIPIVFSVGGDPVKLGLVASLNRPGGNLTGVSFLATDTAAKMLEVLHELVPEAGVIGALVNSGNPQAEVDSAEVKNAARILGLKLHVLSANSQQDIETTFGVLDQQRAGALLIEGDPLFSTRMKQLVVLTARHMIPAIFQGRDFPDAGGLISYGANRADAYRLAGVYTGRVLNGEKPADLPVEQSTKVELVINLATARALGLVVPPSLLARADEVIE
jgi:putative tryptophan/tyrosine transport system substrate-binding protein